MGVGTDDLLAEGVGRGVVLAVDVDVEGVGVEAGFDERVVISRTAPPMTAASTVAPPPIHAAVIPGSRVDLFFGVLLLALPGVPNASPASEFKHNASDRMIRAFGAERARRRPVDDVQIRIDQVSSAGLRGLNLVRRR